MKMEKTYLLNIALLVLAIVAFLFVMEILVRLFVHKIDFHIILDKDIGALRKPNSHGINEGTYYKVKFDINSLGFREKDFEKEKPYNLYRIAFIGDSILEGVQVGYDERFTKVLEEKLNRNENKYKFEVLNFGIGGVGISEEYSILKRYVLQYKPDMVILALSNGDIRQNIHSKSDRELPHITYYDINDNEDLIEVPYVASRFEYLYHFLRKTRLSLYLYEKYLNLNIKLMSNKENVPSEYGVFMKDYDSKWDRAWNVTEKILLSIKNEVESNNSSFLLVISSHLPQIDQNRWNEIMNEYPATKSKEWDLRKPNKMLTDLCNKNRIKCIDSFDSFKRGASKNKLYIQNDDGHLSKNGHELMAQLIYDEIAKENLR